MNKKVKLFELADKKFINVAKGKNLPKNYRDKGDFPVIAAGKSIAYFSSHANYNTNTITISSSGANAGFVWKHTYPIWASDCTVIEVNENINLDYFYLFLLSKQEIIYSFQTGAGQPHVYWKDIKNIEIDLPSLEKQRKIAKTLDKANELIELRKESITKLDALAKSIFIDMFGDPVSNPKGWETKGIESLVRKEKYSIKRGPFGGSLKKEIFVKEGYLVYEQYHALNNDFTFARYFIDEKKYQELKAFEIQAGDIIISCSGVYLGKLAVIPNNFKRGIINQALLKISLDENIMKNVMFINIFTNPNFKKKFFGNNIGSGVPNFPSMQDFKKFEFILPPIELQNKFAKIVEKIEEQKSLYEKELEKLEENFQALLQKSFQE